MATKVLVNNPSGRGFSEVAIQLPDAVSVPATEALAAGAMVELYDNAGTVSARNADKASGKAADGFVNAAVASGAPAEVWKEGSIAGLSGLTLAADYWLGNNGAVTDTKPTTAGQIAQYVGVASSATTICTEIDNPITLA